ncbi:MAG: acetylornithine deacetylase, partial [Magnetospirillum sp.]|nr:acetylornithine deacetylase [Magnetospirillum sp.]
MVELHSDTALTAMLGRLIAFDTTSYKSNVELIAFADDILQQAGAVTRLTWDDTREKANLFATIGPVERPGILLSGHTDVVPVEGQEWSSDPFVAVERDGRIYGRGAADMKGFLAACLAMAPEAGRRRLSAPLHFAFSYDEEIGCVGVRRLIDDLPSLPVQPRLCIVGEPTGMRVVVGHKGKKSVRCQVHGKECHSALNHRGVNAVEVAAEIVAFLRGLQRRIRQHGPFDAGYDPPYTTIHTGLIAGGTALNIVPRRCNFEFEFRNLPQHDAEALMAEVRGFAQDLVPEMLAVDDATGILFDEYNTTVGLLPGGDDGA